MSYIVLETKPVNLAIIIGLISLTAFLLILCSFLWAESSFLQDQVIILRGENNMLYEELQQTEEKVEQLYTSYSSLVVIGGMKCGPSIMKDAANEVESIKTYKKSNAGMGGPVDKN